MVKVLEMINGVIWGLPALALIIGVGVYLTIRTRCIQLRLLPRSIKLFVQRFKSRDMGKEGVSAYRALCTALAATVGTGNLAGVAGAIAIGGPGAVFWMWMCALLGMVIKFAEATLAVRYRVQGNTGEYMGGPMYMIQKGLSKKWHWLAGLYCFFGVVAAFGAGNATQINTMIGGINSVICFFGGTERNEINFLIGVLSGVLVFVLLSGGAKRIGKAAEGIVPFASVVYILLSIGVLVVFYKNIPLALHKIVNGAFSPRAVTGGSVGSVFIALRIGASRGVFTNEAGMGTASIAHAAAEVRHPIEQGLMGIFEVFFDTIVICTMTALVILCAPIEIQYGIDSGVLLTTEAFSCVYGAWISIPIAIILCCFAFATVLGWGLYGARCAQFLFRNNVWKQFAWLSALTVVAGAILRTGTVWMLSETVNGLMAIPNLIALGYLSPEVVKLIYSYKKPPTVLSRR